MLTKHTNLPAVSFSANSQEASKTTHIMKIHTLAQGSQEWLALREGKITGTDIDPFCLDPRPVNLTVPQIKEELDRLGISYKKSGSKPELISCLPDSGIHYCELSNAAKTLLVAKITDSKPKDAWQIAQDAAAERKLSFMVAIQRGNHLEPAARAFYGRKTGFKVEQVGFVSSDCGKYGMSPDGLIMETGTITGAHVPSGITPVKIRRVLEIKCPMPETHRRWLLEHYGKGTVPADHFYQCQMAMVACECDSVDFLSFCPGEAPLLVTLHRSEITEQLADGLRILAEEMDALEHSFAAMWELEYGSPEGSKLLCYSNGNPMFAPDGVMLDPDGNPQPFDNVDEQPSSGNVRPLATGESAADRSQEPS